MGDINEAEMMATWILEEVILTRTNLEIEKYELNKIMEARQKVLNIQLILF